MSIFPLVCPFKKVVDFYEAKVEVPKGDLRFKEKNDNRCVGFIQFTFSSDVIIALTSMTCGLRLELHPLSEKKIVSDFLNGKVRVRFIYITKDLFIL